ncbi:MAG TPA: glycosyltransferase family A protein [Kiritimatiellia bacterium]|nr:glycosyltransferase family A protein [Kiritimatiellia bacterium]HMO98142.1 glycosyltransferase family A protein [Kiritimatiellia bacterium]HMP96198.1 glycosyltransferase family A protein [Kiritimatiellia bacterium]
MKAHDCDTGQAVTAPSVTVLITAYNTRPDYFREAVRSALDQDWPDLEVLIVDDGSNPPLACLVEEFNDPRLVYHRQPFRGLPHALIEGIRLARGEAVAILDHDDRLTPSSIRVRWELLRQTGAGLAYGDIDLMDPSGVVYGRQRFPDFPDVASFVRACLIHPIGPLKHGSVMYRRASALAVGNYDPDLPIEYDLDLIIRVAARDGLAQCHDVVAAYRVHPNNFSRSVVYRLRQIHYRWNVIDKQTCSWGRRWTDKTITALTLVAKALWQGVTHRRPHRLLARLSGSAKRDRIRAHGR